jgi:hypothetical protein
MAATKVDVASLDSNMQKYGQTTSRTIFTVAPFGRAAVLLQPNTWTKVKLRLETAGPVAVGTNIKNIIPVLSGIGALLGEADLELVLKKGDILYIASNATNRVRMVTEPIPWKEQILLRVGAVVDAILGGSPAPAPTTTKKGPSFGNVFGKKW